MAVKLLSIFRCHKNKTSTINVIIQLRNPTVSQQLYSMQHNEGGWGENGLYQIVWQTHTLTHVLALIKLASGDLCVSLPPVPVDIKQSLLTSHSWQGKGGHTGVTVCEL